jgi:hypothetical protein
MCLFQDWLHIDQESMNKRRKSPSSPFKGSIQNSPPTPERELATPMEYNSSFQDDSPLGGQNILRLVGNTKFHYDEEWCLLGCYAVWLL